MPFPVIPNSYLVTQHWDKVGHERHTFASVFCVFRPSGTATNSQIATSFAAAFASTLWQEVSAGATLGATDILPLDGVTPTQSYVTASAGTAGGHTTGNSVPNVMQAVVTWQTAHRGKSYRGRTYLAPLTSDQVVDIATNQLTSGTVASLQSLANGFLTDLLASSPSPLNLMVLSRKLGVASGVLTARANTYVGVQRRRYERVAHD